MTASSFKSSILLYASGKSPPPQSGPAAFALDAAKVLDARLDVFAPFVEFLAPTWRGRSVDEVDQDNAQRRDALEALCKAVLARAAQVGVEAGAQTEWAHPFGVTAFMTDQARLRDLLVCGADTTTFLSEREMAEHMLFGSGRPLVVVPEAYKGPFAGRTIAVAWDHSRVAARALHDAMPFLRQADEILIFSIGDEKRFQTDLDPAAIVDALAEKGLKARFESVALAGHAIADALQQTALDAGAGMLVMGGYGHSRVREFILGGATLGALDDPRLPILLSH